MTGIFRTVLIITLVYLILRLIGSVAARGARRYNKNSSQNNDSTSPKNEPGVPKDIGEYIDYEEVDDDE